jgi:ABC-type nitrate/sulfonate/bicarbonate transport system substrate-binding protein
MDDQIAKLVSQKAGIDPAVVEKVLGALQGFLKENPDKVGAFLGQDSPGGGAAGMLGKLFKH